MSRKSDARYRREPEPKRRYSQGPPQSMDDVQHKYGPPARYSAPRRAGGGRGGIIGAFLFFGLLLFVGYALYRLIF